MSILLILIALFTKVKLTPAKRLYRKKLPFRRKTRFRHFSFKSYFANITLDISYRITLSFIKRENIL